MKTRLTLIAASLVVLVAAVVTLVGAPAEGVVARPAESASAAARQTGYCQVNGCIDMPSDGYCPSGYYRFQGTWCCCPINRQSPNAGPTAVLASAAEQPVTTDLPVSFLGAPMSYGRGRCGRS